jgi:DNA-3-methyladenine glycosylase I
MAVTRCKWSEGNPLMEEYHDTEWGVPVHDDKKHFEFLVLDAFQAGLSWAIVLKKREGFREAFAGFDPKKVAVFGEHEIEELVANPDIIRNRQKIVATINNAKQFIRLQKEHGSFDKFIWQFTGGKTLKNAWKEMKQIPAKTSESDAMSKALIKEGFKFVGSTICYAYMQAAGMVNDHTIDCFRYKNVRVV